jgi:hypothetical protein
MATKYFYAENATRTLAGIRFEIFDISAGTAVGVFATDDEKLAEELKKLPGVFESSQADYESCLKKKQPKYANLNASKPESAPAPVSIKGLGNVVVVEDVAPVEEKIDLKAAVVDESVLIPQAIAEAPINPVAPAESSTTAEAQP